MKIKVIAICCIFSMILTMGLLAGCGASDNSSAAEPQASPVDTTIQETPTEDQLADSDNIVEATPVAEPEEENEDLKELEITANAFIDAYFNGDINKIKNYLTTPYDWYMDSYSGDANSICNTTLYGLNTVGEMEIGDSCTLSYEFKHSSDSDYFVYLRMEFVKEADGWKVSFYGLEG